MGLSSYEGGKDFKGIALIQFMKTTIAVFLWNCTFVQKSWLSLQAMGPQIYRECIVDWGKVRIGFSMARMFHTILTNS